jgi:hypothetical protein
MFNNEPWHVGNNLAGQQLDWMPTDTKESFERMIQDPACRNYFEKQGWTDPGAITYKINRHGFRSEEFESGVPCMIALGCSFTMGIGLPVDCLWPTLIGQQLKLKVYNLAVGGISADTCFRLARYWIPKLQPQLVCMLSPPTTRIELLMAPGYQPTVEVFLPASESIFISKDFENDTFLKHWWLNDENGQINNEKNMLAVRQLAINNHAKFIGLESGQEMSKSREEIGYARDYMHAGPQGQQLVAEKMLKRL